MEPLGSNLSNDMMVQTPLHNKSSLWHPNRAVHVGSHTLRLQKKRAPHAGRKSELHMQATCTHHTHTF